MSISRRLVADRYGSYEVAPDSNLATAPRRLDGWWDRRTTAGRAAIAEFSENQKRRRLLLDGERTMDEIERELRVALK
jgi:hypothetical protein